LGAMDYALAIGGTWDAPVLRFFGDESPKRPGEANPGRQGSCQGTADRVWEHAFTSDEVVIQELR
jgi:hypothetical protein